jgi:hypothetical protein
VSGVVDKVQQSWRRWHWLLDAAVLVLLYEAYSLIQGLVPAHRSVAEANAHRLLGLEQRLDLDPELWLNRFVAAHGWLAQACDYWYASLHFSVSMAVATWLLWRHPGQARRFLVPLYVTTALALLGFWLVPMAPPRLLTGAGFVDTVIRGHTWGGWDSGPVDAVANQYAALPSLHMAWALWCALAVARVSRRRWMRRVVWLYPAGTLFVILGTGNHWLLDAAGGALVLALGFAVARRFLLPSEAARPVMVDQADEPARTLTHGP